MITRFENLENKLGIKFDQKILDDLFNIYKEITGSGWDIYPKLKCVRDDINCNGIYEYRAGSKWGQSKFMITTSQGLYFYPNVGREATKKEWKEITKATILFDKKIKEYLGYIKNKMKIVGRIK